MAAHIESDLYFLCNNQRAAHSFNFVLLKLIPDTVAGSPLLGPVIILIVPADITLVLFYFCGDVLETKMAGYFWLMVLRKQILLM